MIVLEDVKKTVGPFWMRQSVIDGISVRFEPRVNYVILGEAGSGKSTLLALIAGLQRPSAGWVRRAGTVSVPLSFTTRLFPHKTGSGLIRAMSKLYRADAKEVETFVVSSFGFERELLDLPIRTLSRPDQVRLSYAVGYGLPADFLLFDGQTVVGDQAFRDQCKQCLADRRGRVGAILATNNVRLAKAFGDVAAILHRGKLYPFPSVDDAIAAFRDAGEGDAEDGVEVARRLIASGQPGEAIATLKGLIAADGMSAAAAEALVEAQLRHGQVEEAEQTALDALRDKVASPKLLFILARIAESQGRFGDAIRFCKEGLSESEGSREFKLVLARSYEQTGSHGEAGSVYRRMAQQEGSVPLMRLAERNLMKAEAWPGLLEIAEQELEKGADPSYYGAMRFRALCQLDRHDQAAETLRWLASVSMESALGAAVRQRRQLSVERFAAYIGGLDAAAIRAQAHTRSHELIVASIRRDISAERRAGRAAVVAYLSALLNQISGNAQPALDVKPIGED